MQNMWDGKSSLQVKNQQEALLIACQMERRAIRVYERGLLLARDPAIQGMLQRFLGEEQEHLKRFSRMGSLPPEALGAEQELLLSSYAAQILFPGGLMQLFREGALENVPAFLEFAGDSEETAERIYREFAASCADAAVRETFEAIAQEEHIHLRTIRDQLSSLRG